ncbi:hypothetical protein [Calothrix sp. UHCC 0171]|uniref:hypothetical protein n=1 Tax=Calothrix sp. UHCC 0171 TaxID=3110245 RepID=UPI002B20A380|nr:hypothetical protein [Calothrix sp. UHCC 0171]MEA5573011.1 hypothetical protein [Calothrix sp. UHCC 0171]
MGRFVRASVSKGQKESINLFLDRKVAKLSAGIALSAQQRFQYPDNPEIQAAWNNLLKVLGKESVAQEEFVGNAVP